MVVTRVYAREIRLRLAQSLQRLFCPLSLVMSVELPTNSHQTPRCVQKRMADGVDVFNRAVGKKDSEFHFETRRFSDCSIDCSLPLGSILRMNALHPFFPSRWALFWIEAI